METVTPKRSDPQSDTVRIKNDDLFDMSLSQAADSVESVLQGDTSSVIVDSASQSKGLSVCHSSSRKRPLSPASGEGDGDGPDVSSKKTRRDVMRPNRNGPKVSGTVKDNGKTLKTLKTGKNVKKDKKDAKEKTQVTNDKSKSEDIEIDIVSILANLSADMHMQFEAVNEQICDLQKGLEQKIATKVAQVLDKRITGEMNKIQKVVDDKIQAIKSDIQAEVSAELTVMNDKMAELSEKCVRSKGTSVPDSSDIALNVIITGLPEQANEVTVHKVNKLIKDGLKVINIEVEKAERKKSRDTKRPGVVIAKFKSFEDKKNVMLQKNRLNNNKQYSNVFINHDLSYSERRMSDNFRTVLGALRQHGLAVRGSRVVRMNERAEDSDSDSRGRCGHQNVPRGSFSEGAIADTNDNSDTRVSFFRGNNSHRVNYHNCRETWHSDTRNSLLRGGNPHRGGNHDSHMRDSNNRNNPSQEDNYNNDEWQRSGYGGNYNSNRRGRGQGRGYGRNERRDKHSGQRQNNYN